MLLPLPTSRDVKEHRNDDHQCEKTKDSASSDNGDDTDRKSTKLFSHRDLCVESLDRYEEAMLVCENTTVLGIACRSNTDGRLLATSEVNLDERATLHSMAIVLYIGVEASTTRIAGAA